MKYLIILLSVFASLSLFSEEKKDLKNYQTMDLNQFDKVNSAPKNDSNIKFDMNCKSESGVEYKSTDPQYLDCLSKAKNKASK